MKCSYGCGQKAVKQFKNGKYCCSEYFTQCPEVRKKNTGGSPDGLIEYLKNNPHPGYKKGNIPWNTGLTKETDERVRKSAISFSKSQKGRPGRKLSEDTKKKLSKIQQEWIKNGGKIGCGYAKKYWYNSPSAGKVSLDGTWELRVAIFFDGSELNWRRNTEIFKYTKLDGNIGYYKPDFYVYDWNTYIEVKGWEDKNDKLKWEQFPEPLEIWNGDKLVEYGILLSK